ncbi:alpha/beta hydrolase [Candidatus Nitrosocosmicus franklandus]|uniref:Putative esterase n=1 Tax=Candidatus Nitrosocosmicus franklandianus TaxID=1798806 RepID=A0A484I8P2_9ARCH|nr:alpha/beta hydrolase-fold protein [Candidatus Nitrosocosmicus franklandus]VFJ13093.1 putative esterase [Candidatus Nitrosocosmicus franklandus]
MNGKLEYRSFESKALQGNPLGDPIRRDIIIYTSENYKASNSAGYPTIFFLPAFGNDGYSAVKHDPFSISIYERLDRLVKSGKCGDMILTIVNCFNRLGGSQYINSQAIGNYENYMIDEIIPFIDSNYNVSKRAVLGKSSGGYGALSLGMRYPQLFKAIAAHSFDSCFEYCYLPDFPVAIKTLKNYQDPQHWLDVFWSNEFSRTKDDFITLNILSMAAHYSPDTENKGLKIELPFDSVSGNFRDNVWSRWKQYDPVNLVPKYTESLKKMDSIYFDCGISDEFNLQIGTRVVSEKCRSLGVVHEYEQYKGGHFNTNHRYDISLRKIYEALG